VLGRAAVLLGAVIVFFVVSLIVVLLWMSLLRAVFKRTPFIRRSRKLYREDALETGATGIALMLVLTLVVLIGVLSLGQAHDAAVLTKQGRGAPSGALQVIEAEPVRLGWTDRVPSGMGELSRHRLIFLGQSGGETFIYDADDAQTVRLPSELIALFFPNP
jgi:hypothetical protein